MTAPAPQPPESGSVKTRSAAGLRAARHAISTIAAHATHVLADQGFRIDLARAAGDGHRQRHADSFSDGGRRCRRRGQRWRTASSCWPRADHPRHRRRIHAPWRAPVPLDEELAACCPVLRRVRVTGCVPVSVDTCEPGGDAAVLDLGADIINDIGRCAAGRRRSVAAHPVGVCLMHMRGEPPPCRCAAYDDVVAGCGLFARSGAHSAGRGRRARIVLDPGIGFAKTPARILRCCGARRVGENGPVLVGWSRKSTLAAWITGRCGPDGCRASARRRPCCQRGATIVRGARCRGDADALAVLAGAVGHGPATIARQTDRQHDGRKSISAPTASAAPSAIAPITPGLRAAPGPCGGPRCCKRRARHGADRQGHAHLRLHARSRAGGRLRLGRRGRAAQRPAARRRGLPDARAAPGPGRGHQRLAQPLPDNGIKFFSASGEKLPDAWGRPSRPSWRPSHQWAERPAGQGARAGRRRGRYIEFCKSTFGATCRSGAEAGDRRLPPWRGLPHRARRVPRTRRQVIDHRLQPRRPQHQRRRRRHLARPLVARWPSTAPTTASRWTATPTGCSWSTPPGRLYNGDELLYVMVADRMVQRPCRAWWAR